jgi:hypothetical protein
MIPASDDDDDANQAVSSLQIQEWHYCLGFFWAPCDVYSNSAHQETIVCHYHLLASVDLLGACCYCCLMLLPEIYCVVVVVVV